MQLRRSAGFAAIICLTAFTLSGCGDTADLPEEQTRGPSPTLPQPAKALIPTVNIAKATGWPDGEAPKPGEALAVNAFARDLEHPRWLYVLPNGDVLVAESNAPAQPEDDAGGGITGHIRTWVMGWAMKRAGAGVPSPDRIMLLRDGNGDGVAETKTVFLKDLHSPFGMALVGDTLYVANADAVVSFPYQEGETEISAKGQKLTDLPGGPINHHWTKSLVAGPDGKYLYVGVGSNSNVAENGMAAEQDRAAILQVDIETGKSRVYASGLRNPVGMDWKPDSDQLWVVVNERDELGSDLVPDYLTSVQKGGFYGWPYSYWGKHVDERVSPQKPALVEEAIVPDYALGNHVAPLGLAFSKGDLLPKRYAHGAFVGEHGSWNRKPYAGYKVVFVPFKNGAPSGQPVDVLTGFLSDAEKARGRPVGVAIDKSGALLVADDVGNTVWRVAPKTERTAALH
ncbi:Membrane bound L-sorbosone dehydrogenase [Methyloligella halotolerans]|uniref:Membrane bound L-sorbosone dehydrogenase n=1 Tax=Methyloligella halotolerans TaxID=1177755 RepID=A0A1E2RVN1_9HYPH|nr:sorbosone dehydrogenase family protein [Methyloligella halotolerans]ODA66180.1 Membrane bound L-sorbosone dehydrogenase [Methyloligella halotolerans]